MNTKDISKVWESLRLSKKLKKDFTNPSLDPQKMLCIKDSYKSSIWKLNLNTAGYTQPIILKIIKAQKQPRDKSVVEFNIYLKAHQFLKDFMPKIYLIQEGVLNNQIWILMEHIQPLHGQFEFAPKYFNHIIPTLAKLHGHTFNERFHQQKNVFADWLPQYQSRSLEKERQRKNKKTQRQLEKAMKHNDLYKLLKPSYPLLKQILKRGPNYFPEIIEAGQSIVHRDLQTHNIACNHVNRQEAWDVKFIDWEGAKFAPTWFDMVSLVGVFLAYREDWKASEESIIRRCVHLYASEMKKQGITYTIDPVLLFKMAYLQNILEKDLYNQLSWKMSGRKKVFLAPGFIEKINSWGKELGLF